MPEEQSSSYMSERFRELQAAFAEHAQRVEDKVGDHAVRIAKLELQVDQSRTHGERLTKLEMLAADTASALKDLADSRRFNVTTWIAALAMIGTVAAVVVAIIALSK